MSKKIVIKLGGSLYSDSEEKLIDFDYLKNLKQTLSKFIDQDYQFVVSVGGGYLSRKYQDMLSQNVSDPTSLDLDWIGVASICLNAEIVRSYFSDMAESYVVRYKDFDDKSLFDFKKPILVCAAKEPGHSSDMSAVWIAEIIGTRDIFRLTNVDGIYDSNPKENPNAKKHDKLSWVEYFEILGDAEFTPGSHFPLDPVASRKAQSLGLRIFLMDGNELENFDKALKGQSFNGTLVE